ncbi:MAG: hypothetical protein AMXMBFR4_30360 [Candidatus Hydrogenedentota bacterium]
MAQTAEDVFNRLESAIEEWAGEVSSIHERLSSRLAAAKGRLGAASPLEAEVEQVAASVQTAKAEFAALQNALRQCTEVARQSNQRSEEVDRAIAALQDDLRELRRLISEGRRDGGGVAAEEVQALRDEMARLRDELRGPQDAGVILEELRSQIQEQRERTGHIENEVSRIAGLGQSPSIQQWARIQRELAKLRSEVQQLRGSPAEPGFALSAHEEEVEEAMPAVEIDLNLTGFDHAGRRRRMGEMLVEAGVLSQAQLERALAMQQEQPQRRLGSILVELGYAEEDAVAQVLACQARVPFVRLEHESLDPSAVRLVSERLATHHRCIPIRIENDRIVLAMANPMDLIAIEDVELATGRGVDAVAASGPGVDRALRLHYGGETRES